MLHHGSTNFVPRVCPLDALSFSLSLVPEGIKETYEHVMVKFFYYDHLLRKSSYLFMIYGR